MKIYVSGKIGGMLRFNYWSKFGYASTILKEMGHDVINPVNLNDELAIQEFSYEDMMRLCFTAIDICDAIFMLNNWQDSPGAKREHEYALQNNKLVFYSYEQLKNYIEKGANDEHDKAV